MIVKNEEKSLEKCLASVREIADEIIITDTGSTDKTVDVAKRFNASVFHFKWNNNFAEARNFSLKHCTSDFILYLDADEVLSEESIPKIKKILDSDKVNAFRCRIKNIDDFSGRINFGTYCRLFPNVKGIEFQGRVHEQIEYSLKEANVEIIDSDIEIIHHGYNINDKGKARKAERNLPLLLEEFESAPSSYYAYQLGLTYSILEDYKSAETYFNYAYKSESLADDYKLYSLQFLINFALKRKDYVSAKKLSEDIFEFNITHPSVFYIVSKVYSVLGDYEKALMFCSTAYEMNSTPFSERKMNLVFERLNDEEIIYYGIHTSLIAKSEKYFSFFTHKLKTDLGKYEIAEILTGLKWQKKLSRSQINILLNECSKYALDSLMLLIQNYEYINDFPHLLPGLYERFPENSSLLLAFAEYLVSKGDFLTPVNLLENRLEDFKNNPALSFYLISLYVKLNMMDKLEIPLTFLEKNFANDPEVFNGLQKINNELFQTT